MHPIAVSLGMFGWPYVSGWLTQYRMTHKARKSVHASLFSLLVAFVVGIGMNPLGGSIRVHATTATVRLSLDGLGT